MARQSKKVEVQKDAPETLHEHPFYGFQLDPEQEYFRDCIWDDKKQIIFVNAKAGTGKSTIAFATANLLYEYGKYDGIVYIVSPYGEGKQGFLPGDITEKSEVYFEPIYQAMIKCNIFPMKAVYNASLTSQEKEQGYVKCLTHTYLRGTNLENKVVIIDEAQNNTFADLKKILTRVNDGCKVIVIGHNLQKDIDDKTDAFMKYLNYFKSFEDAGDEKVAICTLTKNYRGWVSRMADALEL